MDDRFKAQIKDIRSQGMHFNKDGFDVNEIFIMSICEVT